MAAMSSFVRGKVSKSKRRYVDRENGFDLDLSYITKNIIATGFPSEGLEAKYRNPYTEVIRLLDLKHKDHFKLYNLCSEREYEPSKFYNRVARFPFDDHNAPPFDMIEEFCEDVRRFIAEDERNVAVIHCKAGKGRTGTMICAYLLYSQEWSTAEDSMNFYAAMRTYNKKGVTIPSQIRYIYYFEQYLKHGMPALNSLLLSRIVLSGQPHCQGEIRFHVLTVNKQELFNYKTQALDKPKPKAVKKKGEAEDAAESVAFDCGNVPVLGDIRVEFFDKTKSAISPMFQFWFNTGFVAAGFGNEAPFRLVLQQSELDKANKDKNHKIYPLGFHVILEFQQVDGPSSSSSTVTTRQSIRSTVFEDVPLACPDAAPPRTYSDLMAQYTSLENL